MCSSWISASPVRRYFVSFIVVFSIIQALLLGFVRESNLIVLAENLVASLVADIYSILNGSSIVAGNMLIHVNNGSYVLVDQACLGLSLCASLAAAIYAIPGSLIKRVSAIVTAITCIQLLNSMRITHLFHLIQGDRARFDLFHLYIWQSVSLVLTLIILTLSIQWVRGIRPEVTPCL